MSEPATVDEFLELLERSQLFSDAVLDRVEEQIPSLGEAAADPESLAKSLIKSRLLTLYQAHRLLRGQTDGFYLGKYKLLEVLGRGGMGLVFLAEQTTMKRLVALKVIGRIAKSKDHTLARFAREARAAAALSHPNIVQAYDFDDVDGVPYISMEYVEGIDLERLVAYGGRVPFAQVCDIAMQAASGLECARMHGLVHRDIKPANLLISNTGIVKILDLGLVSSEKEMRDGLTTTEDQVGTVDYMSPEQAIDSRKVDCRCDIYSLGGVIYFLLTGRLPFPGRTTAEKLLKHQTAPPDPIQQFAPEVPAELAAVVEKMLAKKPEQRYQTPAEVEAAIRPFAERILPPFDLAKIKYSRETLSAMLGRSPEPSEINVKEQLIGVISPLQGDTQAVAPRESEAPSTSTSRQPRRAARGRAVPSTLGPVSTAATEAILPDIGELKLKDEAAGAKPTTAPTSAPSASGSNGTAAKSTPVKSTVDPPVASAAEGSQPATNGIERSPASSGSSSKGPTTGNKPPSAAGTTAKPMGSVATSKPAAAAQSGTAAKSGTARTPAAPAAKPGSNPGAANKAAAAAGAPRRVGGGANGNGPARRPAPAATVNDELAGLNDLDEFSAVDDLPAEGDSSDEFAGLVPRKKKGDGKKKGKKKSAEMHPAILWSAIVVGCLAIIAIAIWVINSQVSESRTNSSSNANSVNMMMNSQNAMRNAPTPASPKPPAPPANLPSVLNEAVVRLSFDEPTGAALDTAAKGVGADHAQLVNNPKRVLSPFPGQTGKQAIAFDATNSQYLEIGHGTDLAGPAITVGFFFDANPDPADATGRGLFAKRGALPTGPGFSASYGANYVWQSDLLQLYVVDGGTAYRVVPFSLNEAITQKKPAYLTMVFSPGDAPGADADADQDDVRIQLFSNGQPIAPRPGPGVLIEGTDAWLTDVNIAALTNNFPLTIGASDKSSEFATGIMDEFVIIPRAISAAEVQRLYKEVSGQP